MQCSIDHFIWHPVVLIQGSFLILLGIKGEKGGQRGKEMEGGRGVEGEERGRSRDKWMKIGQYIDT